MNEEDPMTTTPGARRAKQREDGFWQRGCNTGRIVGRADLRMVEAALAKAIEMVRLAHHSHAFGDEDCTPANCSVAEFLEATKP